eukprot:403367119
MLALKSIQNTLQQTAISSTPRNALIMNNVRYFGNFGQYQNPSYYHMYDPTSFYCNNTLLDQLSQLNTAAKEQQSQTQQAALQEVKIDRDGSNQIIESYGEPLLDEIPGVMMIDTYMRKKLKMKKHKRVKRRKLLRNLLKQSGKI